MREQIALNRAKEVTERAFQAWETMNRRREIQKQREGGRADRTRMVERRRSLKRLVLSEADHSSVQEDEEFGRTLL